ncbi:MAG: Abi family protein [Oscillospiraceae bacterium]|nr:Abi family protein [Oscillospiraceae bacterium]
MTLTYHAHKYGALGYMDATTFKPRHDHTRFLQHIANAIKRNHAKAFVKHHMDKYAGNFPLWAIVELFSVGELSRFYADMHRADKKAIARSLFNTSDSNAASWLLCLSKLRNDCAHYSRLYDVPFGTTPATPKGSDYILQDRVFDYLLVLKFLHPDPTQWSTLVNSLAALIEEYSDTIELYRMGFPQDWEPLLA